MFQGIIKTQGRLLKASPTELVISVPKAWKLKKGQSLAVNGVCLTIKKFLRQRAWMDLGNETLKITTLGELKSGENVNLELPLRYGKGISGHFILGHVDATAKITQIKKLANSTLMEIATPQTNQTLIPKGSVAVDGISLTVNEIRNNGSTRFKICLIPETLRRTNLKAKTIGDEVNIEFDYLAKVIQQGVKNAAN